MNRDRTIEVYRYALAIAAREEDPYCRQLGPIHLLKYAYLVDVEYAKYNTGRTFTGIEWTFHCFGPWSGAAFALITMAMSAGNIQERRIASGYTNDDFVRWNMDTDAEMARKTGADLPLEVRGTLEQFVRKFGSDTSSLLHYVYTTPPMLSATPGERLVFSSPPPKEPTATDQFVPLMDRLSKKQKKDFAARMSELRAAFEQRSAIKRPRSLAVRECLDSGYAETTSWVNALAGPAFPDGEVFVEFDDTVWRSETRRGHADG